MDVMSILNYLIKEAHSDPTVKGYNVGLVDGKHPTFEVNVNGNIEHITFLVGNDTEKEIMSALAFKNKEKGYVK